MKVKVVNRVDGLKENLYLPGFFVGLKLTMSHFFSNLFGSKKTVTIQYPEVKRAISMRWRGRHRLTRKEDGFIRCVACYMCETACPSHCIHIEAAESKDGTVEKFPRVFNIDEIRCVFCGLCVEACPKDAIRMDSGVIALTAIERKTFDFTRNLLMDIHKETETTRYKEVPLPEEKDALPNSTGIPANASSSL